MASTAAVTAAAKASIAPRPACASLAVLITRNMRWPPFLFVRRAASLHVDDHGCGLRSDAAEPEGARLDQVYLQHVLPRRRRRPDHEDERLLRADRQIVVEGCQDAVPDDHLAVSRSP